MPRGSTSHGHGLEKSEAGCCARVSPVVRGSPDRATQTTECLIVFAFVVFGVLLAATVIVVVTLGQLPGQIDQQRGHPQAAAIIVASWLGVATLGLLWPIALIFSVLKS